jgi:hypothetical protein
MSAASGPRQGTLFPGSTHLAPESGLALTPEWRLAKAQLLDWQQALARFQAPLFAGHQADTHQGDLFGLGDGGSGDPASAINPLGLRAQTLQFWRWPQAPQQGAALYFVLDAPAGGQQPLLLYVGETGRADQRWKGEHDCKHYLAAYSEAIGRAGLSCQLSIRFWLDVPQAVRPRRQLEQALIRRWQPPFNKETRQRWATPFTADAG